MVRVSGGSSLVHYCLGCHLYLTASPAPPTSLSGAFPHSTLSLVHFAHPFSLFKFLLSRFFLLVHPLRLLPVSSVVCLHRLLHLLYFIIILYFVFCIFFFLRPLLYLSLSFTPPLLNPVSRYHPPKGLASETHLMVDLFPRPPFGGRRRTGREEGAVYVPLVFGGAGGGRGGSPEGFAGRVARG